MSEWIDFGSLRRALSFEKVLVTYGIPLNIRDTPNGKQHNGLCPLKTCEKRSSKGFSANVDQGIWRCFGCGSHGNTLDFIAHLEGLNPARGGEIRRAALIAQEKFLGKKALGRAKPEPIPPRDDGYAKTLVNEPLDFVLKGLNPSHGWFRAHGLKGETVSHFGLGAASRRRLKDRIAIPLYDDATGKLLGYAGRLINERHATEGDPLYLFPEPRIRSGVRHVFDRSHFIYHGHAVKGPVSRLLVVSDMEMVWWLWQHGYGNVVSTMGHRCEHTQAKRVLALVKPGGSVAVVTHAGEDGSRFAHKIMAMCATSSAVRWYATAEEVPSLDAIGLQSLLGLAETSAP